MKSFVCSLCHLSDVPRKTRDLCEDCVASLEARGLAWDTREKRRIQVSDLAPGKTWCVACERARNERYKRNRSAYARAWREAHPTANREWRAAHREQYNAGQRARYAADPERYKAQSRASYQRNRAQRIAYARLWRRRNVALSRANARLGYQRKKLGLWRRMA